MRRYLRSVLVTLGIMSAVAIGIQVTNAVAHCPVPWPGSCETGTQLYIFNCGTDVCNNENIAASCGFCLTDD